MIRFSEEQADCFSSSAEDAYAVRLRRHLVHCCPAALLPDGKDEQLDDTRELINVARSEGLMWQSTIAEFARLSVFRRGSNQVVNPSVLVGPDPKTADAYFSDNMRRARVLNASQRENNVI